MESRIAAGARARAATPLAAVRSTRSSRPEDPPTVVSTFDTSTTIADSSNGYLPLAADRIDHTRRLSDSAAEHPEEPNHRSMAVQAGHPARPARTDVAAGRWVICHPSGQTDPATRSSRLPPVPRPPQSRGSDSSPGPKPPHPSRRIPPLDPPHPPPVVSGSSPGTGPYPTPIGSVPGHRGSRLRRVRCGYPAQAAGRRQAGAHLARFVAARPDALRLVGAGQTGSRGTGDRGAVPDPPVSSTPTTRRDAVAGGAGIDGDLVATPLRPAGAVPGSPSVAAAGSAAATTAAVAPPGAGVTFSLLIIAGSSSRCPRYRLSRPRHQQCGPALGRHLT